jgi:hypothetical protein
LKHHKITTPMKTNRGIILFTLLLQTMNPGNR